jgi:hypothetical protein
MLDAVIAGETEEQKLAELARRKMSGGEARKEARPNRRSGTRF